MGMGYAANFDWVISKEDLEKICGEEVRMIDFLCDKFGVSWDQIASAYVYHDSINFYNIDDEEEAERMDSEVFDTLSELTKKFKAKTNLELELGYHNSSDNGDRYDDIDGVYFSVSGAYKLTDEAIKLLNKGIKIKSATWVSYG